ncbi:FAD dependent oxidoreductase [Linderina pennispora]|uniref:FAD dependent oxidoreductase n=1 Tax=Linderina pennispora TaxID=61395 RepID=A0A1Y1VZ61_9FUNG|nr:FAD dependent oxidoreductase [Linderina pennispora]ORX66315.1 FAD dependent oxidoreductase [Linderina pennispora]
MSNSNETIVIVGGGIVGVSTAFFTVKSLAEKYPAEQRPSVVLLEQCEPGCSASGKQLAEFGYDLHAKLAREYNGPERWGYRPLDTYCAEIDRIPVTPAKQHKTTNKRTEAENMVTSIEVIAAKPQQSLVATPMHYSGPPSPGEEHQDRTHSSFDNACVGNMANTAQVDPLKLTRTLLSEAKALGLQIVKAKVIDVEEPGYRPPILEFPISSQSRLATDEFSIVEPANTPDSTRRASVVKPYLVKVDQGEDIPADKIVVACGAWVTSCLRWQAFREVSASQIPIQGLRAHYLIAKPSEPLPAQAVFAEINGTVYNGEDAIEIYSRMDGSVFVCGEALDDPEMPPHNPFEPVWSKRATNRLKQIVNDVSPSLSFDVINYGLACHLPVHAKGIPVISPVPDAKGLFIAAGHGCWGILNGPATGLAMSELLVDGKCTTLDLTNFRLNRWY